MYFFKVYQRLYYNQPGRQKHLLRDVRCAAWSRVPRHHD